MAAAPPATTATGTATANATSMTTTATSSTAGAAGFDVTLLRRVLRLVHCLQKERGASCAYYASRQAATNGSTTDTDRDNYPNANVISQKSLAVGPARRDTDKALSLSMLRGKDKGDLPIVQKTLAKIRNMLRWNDTAEANTTAIGNNGSSNGNARPRTGLHRFLLCFNTLVSSVIHEYILRQTNLYACASNNSKSPGRKTLWNTSASTSTLDPDAAASATSFMMEKNQPLQHGADIQHDNGSRAGTRGRNRGQSFDLQQAVPQSMPRIHSDNNLPYHDTNISNQGHGHEHVPIADAVSRTESVVQSENEECKGAAGAGAAVPVKSGGASLLRSTNSPYSKQKVTFVETIPVPVHTEESDSVRAVRLLHLLNIFVQLKESTGVERATVSSILADDVDSGLLLNDLVLEVENQRQRVEELDGLEVGPLRNLVQELVVLSPEMLQLQRRLLSGTDLEQALQYCSDDMDNLWDLLTVYIDKLHSLELLIVEEIECCAPADDSDNHIHSSPLLDVPKTTNAALSGSVGIDTPQQETFSNIGIFQHLFGSTGGQNQASLLRQVEAMSPAELKDRLMIALSKDNNNVSASPESTSGTGNGEPRGVEDLLREISCAPASKEWEIDLYEMRFLKQIGQGSAGTTYLANWGGQQVAVKVASITEMGLEGWRTEVQALQKLHHPNIIRLLGSVYHPSPLTICLVLEYCKAGDLSNAIHQLTPRNFFFHVSTSIANGMNYLHNRGIIHRDIKPANVLLDGDFASGLFQVKVTDFGVATESSVERSNERTAETGTYRWMAPEVIRHESYSNLADVYSFAVLMWQLLTREDPFSPKSQIDAAMCVARDCVRPPFPTGTPVAIQELIEACWSDDPAQRLPFDQISTRLKDIESKLTDAEKQWIEAPLGHSVYKKPKKSFSETRLAPQLNVDHVKQPAKQPVKQPIPARSGGKLEKRGGGLLGRLGRK